MRCKSIFVLAAVVVFIITPSLFAGTIVAWGRNVEGQCNVPDGNDFIAIAAGSNHSLAIRSDGTLEAWGSNTDGQCNVPDENNFIAIAAGESHSLALKSDGSIVAWGNNGNGRATPPAGNFIAIAAGQSHSLAIRSDGSLVAWGYNGNGECDVPPGNNFVAVRGGGEYSLALKTDGSLIAWGRDKGGNLAVMPGNDFIAIATGYYHNFVLRSDGSLSGWACNGSCSRGEAFAPSGTNYVAVAVGSSQSVALRSDGSLIAWGSNDYGIWNYPAGKNFVAIASGSSGYHALALTGQLQPVTPKLEADLNKDGRVDIADFAIFSSQWLMGIENIIKEFSLDTNPNWTTNGQWTYGTPTGSGGAMHGFSDPNTGYTGSNVYGVNLNGDYNVAVGGPYTLTAGPFNCSAYHTVKFNFARWLNTDTGDYVRCLVEVSNDGSNWQTIWENPATEALMDNQWQPQSFDISGIADRQASVYIRWSYQIWDNHAFPYSGWNIDDVELWGQQEEN